MPITTQTTTKAAPATTAAGSPLAARFAQLGQRAPGPRERMRFTEQLALLLDTGTALFEALRTLREQARQPGMIAILDDLIEDVSDGKPFSVALGRHPAFFPISYVRLVGAAEVGGFLPEVLEQLLDMDERSEKLRSELKAAMSYPAFLLVFSGAVVVFVLAVVFPKFADLFATIRDQLPGSTLVFMALSDLLRSYWWAVLGGAAALVLGVARWARSESGRDHLDRLKLRLPVVRQLFMQVYLVQSMRVMGLSLQNGVSVMDTLVACREVVGNRLFQRFLVSAEDRVRAGEGLSAAFRDAEFIPLSVRQMIATGEATGNLAKVMNRIAVYQERELDKRLKTVARLAEPVMLIVMGAVVGLIVSSLILPIFKLSQTVS